MFAREKKRTVPLCGNSPLRVPSASYFYFSFSFFFFTLQTICSQTDDGNVSVVNLSTLLNTVALLA